jgi:D-alanyl-D-alanine carboxypeptidase/D-alanyl-D-alanine-endopeptidase (penicillin-binding protein 4)
LEPRSKTVSLTLHASRFTRRAATNPALAKPCGVFQHEPVKYIRSNVLMVVLFALHSLAQDSKPAAKPEPRPAATLAELQQRLADEVAQPRFSNAFWGIKVVSLDTGKTLFEHEANKLFSPASNCKLYTVALALDRLGPDYRIRTSLYANAKPDASGSLEGNLIVYGRGDPTINARLHGGAVLKALEPLVAALTNAGVKRITGDLVGDESFFRGAPYGSGWGWGDLDNYYGAEISALTIDDNTVAASCKPGASVGAPCQVTLAPATSSLVINNHTRTAPKGSPRTIRIHRPFDEDTVYVTGQLPLDDTGTSDDVTVRHPAEIFVECLKRALTARGVDVRGKLRVVRDVDRPAGPLDCDKLVELGSMDSLPMRDLAREVEKPSQNLYADLLLAQVGEKVRPPQNATETSEELGAREMSKFLAEAGLSRGSYALEEGSGLSRDNLASPDATVTLLQYMSRHKSAQVYLDALPIAGVDGTLRNRMKNTPAMGNLRAKTGTLRWANSLSGYVSTAAGEHLAFSLMLNRYHPAGQAHSSREDLDAIAIQLASFTGRSSEQ